MFKRLYWPILACFVIASATLNLFQMRRIAVLNDQVRRAGVRSGDTVPVGLQVRPITLTHPDGAQVVVEFSHTGGKTLLYVFRPGCSWCVKNADSIRELAMRLRRSHRIIGVSLSGAGLSEYMRELIRRRREGAEGELARPPAGVQRHPAGAAAEDSNDVGIKEDE